MPSEQMSGISQLDRCLLLKQSHATGFYSYLLILQIMDEQAKSIFLNLRKHQMLSILNNAITFGLLILLSLQTFFFVALAML